MIGKRLQSILTEKGMTQRELAVKMNLSPQAISLWVNDKSDPDLENFKLLAEIMEVSADELLED